MRITEHQREVIKQLASQVFGADTQVSLFGSRVDESARGGDIDLYIQPVDTRSLFRKKRRMASLLQLSLGDQAFDIVLADNPNRPIEQEARRTGVRL